VNGIYVGTAADFTTIDHNFIVCNTTGIVVLGANATIFTNVVGGVERSSVTALPNGLGLSMSGAGATYAHISYNTFSSNTGNGVDLTNGAHYNSLRGNQIGVKTSRNAVVPNGQSGLAIYNSAYSNTIGVFSDAALDINMIGGNAAYGVYIGDSTTVSNALYNNYIGYSAYGAFGLM